MNSVASLKSTLGDDQLVFLHALVDLGGESDKTEIREQIHELYPSLQDDFNSSKVEYQITRTSDGNSQVDGFHLVETFNQGLDDNGSNLPKGVRVREDVEEIVDEVVGDFDGGGEAGFGSFEEAHSKHLDEIEELKERVNTLEAEKNELESSFEQELNELEDDFDEAIQKIVSGEVEIGGESDNKGGL